MATLRHPDADQESDGRAQSAPSEVKPLGTPPSLIPRDRVFKVGRNGSSVEIHLHGPGGTVADSGAGPVFPGSDRESLKALDLTVRSGKAQHVAFRQVADGQMRDYQATLVPASQGEVLAFVRDISSHRDLAQRFVQTERMPRSDTSSGASPTISTTSSQPSWRIARWPCTSPRPPTLPAT